MFQSMADYRSKLMGILRKKNAQKFSRTSGSCIYFYKKKIIYMWLFQDI